MIELASMAFQKHYEVRIDDSYLMLAGEKGSQPDIGERGPGHDEAWAELAFGHPAGQGEALVRRRPQIRRIVIVVELKAILPSDVVGDPATVSKVAGL